MPVLVGKCLAEIRGFAYHNVEMVRMGGWRVVEEVVHFQGFGVLNVSVFVITRYGGALL